jgi:hypothetical protein
MADGYYYNERFGLVFDDRLVLKAIADISDSANVNINILTHISRGRLRFLIQNEKLSFNEAKKQTQKEVLSVFNLDDNYSIDFEKLDLSRQGILNSKLLAISSILQGSKKAVSLSSLIESISLDLQNDGIIDSKDIQTDLITSACLLDIGTIRRNLNSYYGDTITRDFQVYCNQFIDSSNYQSLFKLEVPDKVDNIENILYKSDNSKIEVEKYYCIAQDFENSSISKLTSCSFSIGIVKTSDSGELKFESNNLSGWDYDSTYCVGVETENGMVNNCGIRLFCWDFINASKNPVRLKVSGSGEMEVNIFIQSESLPDNGGLYTINKYIKW